MFYDKIKGLCDKQGISVTELTGKIGISGSNATDWRKGSKPRASTIKAIADYFDIEVSYFNDTANIVVGASHFVQGNQNTVTFGNGEKITRELTEIEAELLKLCGQMDTKQKNELLNFAYSFFENK